MLSVLIRTTTYAALFIGVVLVYLPAQMLSWVGVARPAGLGLPQLAGILASGCGATLAVWCIFSFAVIGRGTPAPFDPPRRLVLRGPYPHVRTPMYLGASLALAGAALFYQTAALVAYAAAFLLLMHCVVVLYEEPTLRQAFGEDYEAYCQQVHRWWPKARHVAAGAAQHR